MLREIIVLTNIYSIKSTLIKFPNEPVNDILQPETAYDLLWPMT